MEDAGETMLLIAVELEDRYQRMLETVADSLAQYRRQGIPVQVRMDETQGVTLQPELSEALVH
ncbi:hypothetical protein DB31_8042 [Hyalangium minutum]|uniref:Uncharacterized protein n=1 Tax=Hyalangium minutum TaxID=394096 RepID=A0A085WIP6_9BACT|nr:hypothetical protein DB31_8042 [Hyalangium minutum]